MQADRSVSRRDFLKTSAAVTAAGLVASRGVFAAGSDTIRVGLIGCGGRGTGAVADCMNADPGVVLVAMADLFEDRLSGSFNDLAGKFRDRVKVTPDRKFVGFDGYKKLVALDDVDLVIHAAPPGFRPIHLEAIVDAGKHTFMEKPAGVDPVGMRMVIAAAEKARQKGLSIVAGTQRRHQWHYVDIMKRIQDGALGDIRAAQCYWNGGDMIGYWKWWEKGDMDGMTWQCRSWPWFVWTSGDHYVEQHVHNLDIVNWAIGSHPVSAMGMGGRQVRTQGNIYDHFAVEYEYPGGIRVQSMARQINGCVDRVSEHIVGTKGTAYTDGSVGKMYVGGQEYQYKGENPNPYVQEHVDLIAGIRKGEPLNEGRRVAESTMTAILGRMSAYTGRAISWDWAMKASKLDLRPEKYEFGPLPMRPVAMPGKTQLV